MLRLSSYVTQGKYKCIMWQITNLIQYVKLRALPATDPGGFISSSIIFGFILIISFWWSSLLSFLRQTAQVKRLKQFKNTDMFQVLPQPDLNPALKVFLMLQVIKLFIRFRQAATRWYHSWTQPQMGCCMVLTTVIKYFWKAHLFYSYFVFLFGAGIQNPVERTAVV